MKQIKTATAQCHGTYKNSIYLLPFQKKKPTFLLNPKPLTCSSQKFKEA
jgi:hypothetical protein